ncbi:GNAT family N-acetyltransferase [Robertmurraya massiliosenegalensis]|uniref:GNAT family N-acetyltransferase n=1 Tax=Robertmurraya massiliosenegalensis TaxID=1287657 RepID=UPI0002F1AB51|nr:N-acetyltransferase [Robertmurraya massiliosenegalensis]
MIEIRRIIDLDEVSTFIEKMNTEPMNHVGYCGTDKDEIKHALLTDFSDLSLEYSLIGAFLHDQLVGAIGLDIDKESIEAEVWGPFISNPEWDEMADLLWETLIRELPVALKTVYGFYNVKNTNGIKFIEKLGAIKSGEHSVLQISEHNIISRKGSTVNIREYEEKDFIPFQCLHHEAFPNTYLSADEMSNKHGSEQKLLIAENHQQFCGYVFCEANPSFSEGNIEFIAVSPSFRKQGIGNALMKKALDFLFSFKEIEVISLTVNVENQAALNVYLRSGFKEQQRLFAYRCQL